MKFNERLKYLREELGLSQTALAKLCEVSRHAQMSYERGDSSPTQEYIEKLNKVGFDIVFLLTGKIDPEVLNQEETELITNFRRSPTILKNAVKSILKYSDEL